MKTIYVVLLALFSAVCSSVSRASVTLASSVYDSYLARPGFYLYDEPVLQNELVIRGKSLYVGIWSSSALKSSETGKYENEFQGYVGLKKSFGWMTVDGNLRYDALRDLRMSNDDMWMIDARADFTKVPIVQPYVSVRHFHPVSQGAYDDGWFVWFGARQVQDLGFKLSGGETKLSLDASCAYSEGALGRDSGWVYARLGTQLIVPLSEQVSLIPQLLIQVPVDDQGVGSKSYTDGQTHCVGGLNLVYKF